MDPKTTNAVPDPEGGHTSPAVEPRSANRPRGRPPGSKNKPKPSPSPSVHPHVPRILVLEVAAGADVISCLADYARDNRCCVTVHQATGSVDGTICFCDSGPIFKAPFKIISLYGTIYPPASDTLFFIDADGTIFPPFSATPALTLCVAAGDGGKLIGGMVKGSLIASGPVLVSVFTFPNMPPEKIPPV